MNSNFRKLSRIIVAVLMVTLPFLIGGCAPESKTPSPVPEKIELGELKELERSIVIEAEGETLHYLEEKNGLRESYHG